MHSLFKDKKTIFLLVFPGLIVFLYAVFFPIVLSGYFGMTEWSGLGKPVFIGLENFKNLIFNDITFRMSLRNSLFLGLALIFIQHPLCLGAAVMIDKIGGKLEKVFRAIFFIPCVISVVVTSKMWVGIYDSQYGLLNKILDMLHLGFLKQEWLANPKLVLGSLFVIIMWQGFGWGMLIYYAGIKGISEDVYEAAKIDGAGAFELFKSITFPLLKPVVKINLTLAMISAFKQMEVIYLTTNGGPGNASQFIANYLYIKAFNSYQYGYGNAISILFVIVCILVTVIINKIVRKEVIEY